MRMLQSIKDIERTTGLIYAGVTQACGMPIDVYTKSGKLPLWSGAEDPAPIDNTAKEEDKKVTFITVYLLTEKGIESLSQWDKSITDEKYTRIMRTLEAIRPGDKRQINLAAALNLPQQKVWYLVQKLTNQGLIATESIAQ